MFAFLTLQELLMRLVAAALLVALKGWLQAWVAARLGDAGPSQDGRLSLNPAQHLSLWGLLALVLFKVGWTKPLKLDPERLGGRGMLGVAVAGLGACVGLALVAALLRPLVSGAFAQGDVGFVLVAWLNTVVEMALWCAVFNLIPLFPLDAFTVLSGFVKGWWERVWSYVLYFELALLALAWANSSWGWLEPLQQSLRRLIAG